MIIITSPQTALGIEDADVRRLVLKRFHQIWETGIYDSQFGDLLVVDPGDTIAALEEASGCPILHNPFDGTRFGDPDFSPMFEAIEDHAGCYEIVAILNDDGFGVALFVPMRPGIDADLLAMCAAHSQPAS